MLSENEMLDKLLQHLYKINSFIHPSEILLRNSHIFIDEPTILSILDVFKDEKIIIPKPRSLEISITSKGREIIEKYGTYSKYKEQKELIIQQKEIKQNKYIKFSKKTTYIIIIISVLTLLSTQEQKLKEIIKLLYIAICHLLKITI